jgi:hypothetical protein
VPLLFLQHFTGTLDNWDPVVTDPLTLGGSVILFESPGIGRSSGRVPETVAGMADHARKSLDPTDQVFGLVERKVRWNAGKGKTAADREPSRYCLPLHI